jgi:hypothetical protein
LPPFQVVSLRLGFGSAAGVLFSTLVAMLRNAPRANHLHVLVHQSARAGGIAYFDE